MKDEFDKQLLAITGGRNALPVEVSKAHEAVVAKYLDLIPIEATRYAIPKERIEAAAKLLCREAAEATGTPKEKMWELYDGAFTGQAMGVLTAALNGEVLPVEAVGRLAVCDTVDEDSGTWSEDVVLIVDDNGNEPIVTGRTVALVAEKEREE